MFKTALVNNPSSASSGLISIPQAPSSISPINPMILPSNSNVVLQFTPPNPPKLASSLPDHMIIEAGPFNLLEEIRHAQSQFSVAGKQKMHLYSFPSYLTTNIRRVLSRNRNHKADWSVAFSCLVWHGLVRYNSLSAAQSLSESLLELDGDDDIDTVAAEQVETWRRGFRFSIDDPTHSMGLEKRRSFNAPEQVHSELFDTAGRLGLSGSVLAILCIMTSLQDQEGVLSAHAAFMREKTAEFESMLKERTRRLAGLVRAIDAGVWR